MRIAQNEIIIESGTEMREQSSSFSRFFVQFASKSFSKSDHQISQFFTCFHFFFLIFWIWTNGIYSTIGHVQIEMRLAFAAVAIRAYNFHRCEFIIQNVWTILLHFTIRTKHTNHKNSIAFHSDVNSSKIVWVASVKYVLNFIFSNQHEHSCFFVWILITIHRCCSANVVGGYNRAWIVAFTLFPFILFNVCLVFLICFHKIGRRLTLLL